MLPFPFDKIKVGSLLLSRGKNTCIITEIDSSGVVGFNVDLNYYRFFVSVKGLSHNFIDVLVE